LNEDTALEEFSRLEADVSVCTLCALSQTRTNAVPGEGDRRAEIMFIGEGPGQNEDMQGRPFVGRAGQFLNQLIELIGLKRSDVYITNVVKCRPPANRDPLPYELAACLPFLQAQIRLVNPTVIVTLGRYSLGTFFPGETISRIHGSVREVNGRYFYPMYHPAAALHQERYRTTIIDDMRSLGRWIEERRHSETAILSTQPAPEEEADPEQLALF
jgi:uracil-DNA glycosylase family 4